MIQDTRPQCQRLLRELRGDLPAISTLVTAGIESGEQDYGEAVLGRQELSSIVADSVAALLDAMAGLEYSVEPARRAGRLKAERGVPMESLLHAFRIAGMAFWEVVVDRSDQYDAPALPQLSTRVWAAVDAYSVAAVDAYRRIVLSGDGHTGQRLLRILLDPEFPSAQRADLGMRMRLPAMSTFVVLVGEVHFAVPGLTTVGTHLGEERVTLAAGAPSVLGRALRMTAARAGASRPFTDLGGAPAALDQARLAFRCLSPADTGIHTYASSPARILIAAHPELAADAFSKPVAAFDRLPPNDAAELVRTALAWYELGGSTAEVGERLHLHRNTVLHRLKRIEQLTGWAFGNPADTAMLYLALQSRLLRGACEQG